MVPWTHPTQHPKLHFVRCSRFCTARGTESLYCTIFSPSKLPLHMRDMEPHLIMVPSAHPSPNPKRHHDRFSCFAGFTILRERPTDRQTDRQTDHATPSVTIGRIYVLYSSTMRTYKCYSKHSFHHLFMVALWNRADHYIFALSFVVVVLLFFLA